MSEVKEMALKRGAGVQGYLPRKAGMAVSGCVRCVQSRAWALLVLGWFVGLRPAQNAQRCVFAGAVSRCYVLNFPKDGSRGILCLPVPSIVPMWFLEHCGSCCFNCCDHQQGEHDPAVSCDGFAACFGGTG